MLKITPIADSHGQLIRLEGSLREPWVAELRTVCRSPSTRLDLSAVTFVDAAGTRLLAELIRRGVRVAACSRFVAELLQLEVQP